MNDAPSPSDLSPTASHWFALRRWHRRHPLGGWAITCALVLLANATLHAIGRLSPAPFLPFYPVVILATLLGGRRLGYAAVLVSLVSAALFLGAGSSGPVPLAATLVLSLLVSVLVVEVLAQLGALAETLFAREATLTAATLALIAEEARLSAALNELETLYDGAPIGLGFLDRNLRFVRINAALAEINGFSVAAHIGKSVWDLVPDLRASAEPMLRRVLDHDEVIRGVELSGETPAQPGVRRDWLEMFYPVHDRTGAVQGVGIFCQEVTEAKRAHEREQLLTREVDHRAKNLLTVIQSVLKLTRSAGTVEEFRAAVTGRIQSLGRVHALLAQSRWQAIELEALVRRELEPFGPAIRIGAITRDLRIQPNVAQALSMILHELATNSVKHGALMKAEGAGAGRVDFNCVQVAAPDSIGPERVSLPPTEADDGAAAQPGTTVSIILTWQEHGGPPVTQPDRTGFGTSLIRTAVRGLLAGELDYQLNAEGLRCEIRFPLSRAMPPTVWGE